MPAIRDTTEDDWQLLCDVRLRALQDSPGAFTSTYGVEASYDERRWRELLHDQIWLLAFEDGSADQPIGMIAASREPHPPAGEPFISSLWVRPEHRRHGIATRLIRVATDPGARQWRDGGVALGPRRQRRGMEILPRCRFCPHRSAPAGSRLFEPVRVAHALEPAVSGLRRGRSAGSHLYVRAPGRRPADSVT